MLGFDAVGRVAVGQVTTFRSIALSGATGTFAVTGGSATFSTRLAGATGAYSVTVGAVTFRAALSASGTTYRITGKTVIAGYPGTFTLSRWNPVPKFAVELVRPATDQDLIRVFTDWGYGEYQFTQLLKDVWELNGAAAIGSGKAVTLVPYDAPSVWEFAGKIGGGGEAENTFNFFGMAHGNISTAIPRLIQVDGVDASNIGSGFSAGGNSISYTQVFRILLPRDNSIVCGTLQVKHTFDTTGLLVEISLDPLPGFEWYNVYTGMLPSGAFDRITFGNKPTEPVLLPAIPATNDRGSQFSTYMASSSQHPFGIKLTLPSGGPNNTGSWADAGLDSAFWIDQSTGAKIYVTDISTAFADRKTAFARQSSTHYSIVKAGDAGGGKLGVNERWTRVG